MKDWIVVENTHEAIVDKELFDRVRAIMGQKVEDSTFSPERGKTGKMICGYCGHRMSHSYSGRPKYY